MNYFLGGWMLLADKKKREEQTTKTYRSDGRVELVCEHGCGHTTYDSAVECAENHGEIKPDGSNREEVISAWLSHGCCGCCSNYEECVKK
jgi:hypothetical protein